ncbi:CapA family protein [Streptomyces sp. NRRL S-340]|uniref:CapA family protein n=1 Tax=Streptomyces sp. NRRL S-340 TaxID=1463901 RepID=UPI00131C111D|nr:CapA family protein [Streptomyces sp. NRRL S-340]
MDELQIVAVGDVFVHRERPEEAFQHVSSAFQQADTTFANLEGVYCTTQERAPSAGVPVIADPSHARGVAGAGVDVVSLANNHSLDGGTLALLETRALMRGSGVATAGAGENREDAHRPAVLDTRRGRVAVLAYASVFPCGYEARPGVPGLAPLRASTLYTPWETNEWNPGLLPRVTTVPDEGDMEVLREDVARARDQADVVLASFHWGDFTRPYVLTDHETRTARAAIDAGADAVLGHHHHLLRGIEFHRGRPIFYGLGHFAFDLPGLEERLRKSAYLGRGDARLRRESARRFGEFRIGPREGHPLLPFHPDGRLTGFALIGWADGSIRAGFAPCVLGPDNSPRPVAASTPEGKEVIDYLERACAYEELPTRFERDAYTFHGIHVTAVRPADRPAAPRTSA